MMSYGAWGSVRLYLSWLVTKLFFRPARLIRLPAYIRGRSAIVWGEGFTTGVGVRLDAFNTDKNKKIMVFGKRVQLNDYVHIGATTGVTIGDDVLIASRVFISDHNHGHYNLAFSSSPDVPPSSRELDSSPVSIGDRVWIGEGVCILPGVRIGSGAIVGAGAVVTQDLPADTISVGVPAKVIKRYDRLQGKWTHV